MSNQIGVFQSKLQWRKKEILMKYFESIIVFIKQQNRQWLNHWKKAEFLFYFLQISQDA